MGAEYPAILVALFAIGIGISFLAADPESPTSRALAASWVMLGAAIATYVGQNLGFAPDWPRLWPRLHAVTETVALVAGFEWLRRLGRTAESCRTGLLRLAQACALGFGAAGLLFPDARASTIDRGWDLSLLARPEYYLFAVPFWASFGFSSFRAVEMLRSDLDESERVRLLAFMAATPLLVAGLIVPAEWGPLTTALGEILFLSGAIRYFVLQGQRGQFLARFLSPQVAELVREQGLSRTLHQKRVQLSVVACDLRGFTPFSETAAPEDVMQLLGEYYEVLGHVVTRLGGTIKDLAGDGMLALVGAPLPMVDHAERAVALATELGAELTRVLGRWRALGLDLGFGIGVASGFVTVGAISGAGRFEYVAVGPAVNLAARLCDRAEAGRILVDQRTIGLLPIGADTSRFARRDGLELKGLSRPVTAHEALADPSA